MNQQLILSYTSSKALNEAMLGAFQFAKIHEAASQRYHQDAELLAKGGLPVHQSVSHYFSIAEAYRSDDREKTISNHRELKSVA